MGGKTTTIGTSMISSVLPPVVEKAASLLLDRALDQYDIMVNIQRDIRSLKTKLNEVNEILQEAEESQIDNINVRELLRELVDIGYEARDVFDDFMTAASINTNRNITAASIVTNRTTSRWVIFDCFPFSFFLRCFGITELPFPLRFELANGIKSVMERLDEIMEQRDIVDIRESLRKGGSKSESPSRSRPKTSCFVNRQRNLFVGREDEKDEIIKKLVHHDGNGVLVVPIWGIGGVGKTTLAQFIYNDERVKEEDYPICNRKWLFVGERKFNAKEIIARIIGKSDTQSIEVIQGKLVQNFKGNKFLIVLDDVWDLDSNQWNLLFSPLTFVGKGGVIIITTRIRGVISATNTQVPTDLRPLSSERCWEIFESHAFIDGKSSNRPELEPIGREIVEKVDGLPLAARVVGSSLLNEPDATWSDFINNWEWNLRNNDHEIMAALTWSYKLLPPHLKHCFAYCALFPKDHVFDEKVLVEMWMAHDLIQINGDRRPEDIGTQYFKELTYASLIQCVDERYVMHDMIHDLALRVSNEECSSAVGSLSTDQMKEVRHITITDDDDDDDDVYSKNLSLCKSKRILTVYALSNTWQERGTFKKDILLEVFKQSKSIRVLVLCNDGIKEIPECISELRHLRYLDVSETRVESFPDSLCHLYNLQTLAAPLDAILPRNIVNMANLKHLRANLSTCKGVGKLTSLQELSSIRVCEGDNIIELGDMQRLRGKLVISDLGNAEKLEDDVGALMEKQTLMDELELVFDEYSAEPTISAQVLDALGCPPNLTYLRIYGYKGVKPPSWMVDGKHKFDKLQTLQLYNCTELESLPPLGELTSLKRLYLRNVGVKRLGDEFYGKLTECKVFFPSLESLEFSDMSEWEEWDDIIIENSSVSFFPRLTTLNLSNCLKLESLPPLGELTSLEDLSLESVGVKRLGGEFYGKFTDGKVFFPSLESLSFSLMEEWEEWNDIIIENSSVPFFPRLTTLKLSNCPKLESLPPLGELTSLKDLYLRNVGVKRLGDEFYGKFTDGKVFFPSLEMLEFSFMQEWEEWDDIIIENSSVSFFPRLTRLEIFRCLKLVSILPVVKNPTMNAANFIKSLSRLEIWDCPQLQSLPAYGLPPSLTYLRIVRCPLLYERCKDESGVDWHKINHIPDKEIRKHYWSVEI